MGLKTFSISTQAGRTSKSYRSSTGHATAGKGKSVTVGSGFVVSSNSVMIKPSAIISNSGVTIWKQAMFPSSDPLINEPEIASMNKVQLEAAIMAQYGSWADRDDITDDWLNDLRRESDERLYTIYNPPS